MKKLVFHGNRHEKKIAITFDDGPCEDTPQILSELKKHDIKATFFLVGKMISGREQIVERAKQNGHEFGNHTYSHANLWFKKKSFIEEEIRRCDNELARVGISTNLIRFPAFKCGFNAILVSRKLNKKIIFADIISFKRKTYDWYEPLMNKNGKLNRAIEINDVAKETLKNVRNGSILVFHDYLQGIGPHPELIPILRAILPKLKAKGFEFVTVSELIQSK